MARNYIAPALRGVSLAAIAALCFMQHANATINIGTTNASDGAFSPVANTTVNLSQAITGAWDADNAANAGKGRYDASKWAVVYKYASVNIPAAVTVTFTNHPTHAPVVWLVQGNVTIAGTVNVNGANGAATGANAEPGPGGFRGGSGGGTAIPPSAGYGYGGGAYRAAGPSASGSYATVGPYNTGWSYGSPGILQLIGGSGAGGEPLLKDGGAGGGAILIVARGTISVGGAILAKGGNAPTGGGSGGAIRLVADILTGGGSMDATSVTNSGQTGGQGRIRLEANQSSMSASATPTASVGIPIGTDAAVFPAASAPLAVITQIGGVIVPADPKASFQLPNQDVTIATTASIKVRVQATNVPLTWSINVRVMRKSGDDLSAAATRISGDAASSVWEATIPTMPSGLSSVVARAYAP